MKKVLIGAIIAVVMVIFFAIIAVVIVIFFSAFMLVSDRSADDSTSMPAPESASEQTEHRPAAFLSTGDAFWTVDQSLNHAQIKRSALQVPYDVLMLYEHDGETWSYHPPYLDECVFEGTDVCDRFVGNLVHHSGVLYGYYDHWGNDDTVVLSLGLTDDTCAESKNVHVIYVPSDEERRWLENEPEFLTTCHESERRINFWGTHVGFYGGEYTTPTPLISGHIVELVEPDRTSVPAPESASEQTEHRPAAFLSTGDAFWTVDQSLNHAQIKRSALQVPYDVLMLYEHDGETWSYDLPYSDECVFEGTDVCDRFVGNLIHNSGVLYSYKDHWGNDDTVVLSLGLTDDTWAESKNVHVIYVPSDEERRWLEDEPEFFMSYHEPERRINFWGTHVGFYGGEHTTPTPLISGHIVELVEPDRKVSFSGIVQHHTVSFDDLPSYVDVAVVDRGLRDAVQAWNNGGSVKFTMVKSDGDVNIGWNRGGAGLALGHYGARVLDDGTKENHFIRVNLGGEDCHSDYQQFASDSLKRTIAHELGHYLGLRHAADPTHLMHTGGFTKGDSRSIYDSHGLVIPEIGRPDAATVKGQSVEFEVDSAYKELERLTHDPPAYNALAAKIVDLETEIACQQAR